MKTATLNSAAKGSASFHSWSSASATSTWLNLNRKTRSSSWPLLLLRLDLLLLLLESQPPCLRAWTATAARLHRHEDTQGVG